MKTFLKYLIIVIILVVVFIASLIYKFGSGVVEDLEREEYLIQKTNLVLGFPEDTVINRSFYNDELLRITDSLLRKHDNLDTVRIKYKPSSNSIW